MVGRFPIRVRHGRGEYPRGGRRVSSIIAPEPEARTESREWFRERRESGWLNGNRASIIEVKVTGGTWRALGQLIMHRGSFEMDWDATVDELIAVADTSVPGKESEQLFTRPDEVDLVIYEDGELR